MEEVNQVVVTTTPEQPDNPQKLGGITGKGWVPGQSGNPSGRPKGSISIKDKIRQYLEDNPDAVDEIVAHFIKENRELMWQMLEGKPKQELEVDVDKESLSELTQFFKAIAQPNDKAGSTSLPDRPPSIQE